VRGDELIFHESFDSKKSVLDNGGIITGDVDFVDAKHGSGAKIFEGNKIDFPGEGNFNQEAATIELWVQGDDLWHIGRGKTLLWLNNDWHFQITCNESERLIFFRAYEPEPWGYLFMSPEAALELDKAADQFHQFVISWNGNEQASIFINGRLDASQDTGVDWKRLQMIAQINQIVLGGGGRPPNAVYDEILIYDYPLSEEEVAASFENGPGVTTQQAVNPDDGKLTTSWGAIKR